jgi:hypothetical protein
MPKRYVRVRGVSLVAIGAIFVAGNAYSGASVMNIGLPQFDDHVATGDASVKSMVMTQVAPAMSLSQQNTSSPKAIKKVPASDNSPKVERDFYRAGEEVAR